MADRLEILGNESSGMRILVRGKDRPGVIARYTGIIDMSACYIDSMGYHLGLIDQESRPFTLEIKVKGEVKDLEKLVGHLGGLQIHPALNEAESISAQHWEIGELFVILLTIPDRKGITAELTDIISGLNDGVTEREPGNIIYCHSYTLNSGGPQGGVPYYQIQAQVHSQSKEIQGAIQRDLENTFSSEVVDDGLRIVNLREK